MARPSTNTCSGSRSSSTSSTHSHSTNRQPHANADITSHQPSSQLEENANLKRTVDLLKLELEEVKGGKKRVSSSPQALGRGISRLGSLFVNVKTLVRGYLTYMAETEQPTFDVSGLTEQEKEEHRQRKHEANRNLESFKIICELVPTLMGRVRNIGEVELEELFAYCDKLQTGAVAARSDDIHSMKFALAQWLNFRGPGQCAVPLLQPDDRAGRGFTNDLTGKLLTPIHISWDESSEAIRTKALDTSNSFFIRAFYEGEEGDSKDVEHGFLRSSLLLQTWRQIFLSDSTVEIAGASSNSTVTPYKKARKSTRKNVAQLLDMKEVTPCSVAYACVMLRFSLSDASAWSSDQSFNYQGLYNTIVDYLDDAESGFEEAEDDIQELLDWWTKNVFAKPDASTSVQPVHNFNNTIQEQRAAKRARMNSTAR
ncbi:hypothetical protein C8R42DRAFT_730038 [Lentinula raphanica]|nr:hypothetical protein C8R42DRAFT_730038 [Lentinula raphanica]